MKELKIIHESIQQVTGVDIKLKSRKRPVADAKAMFYYFAKQLLGKEEVMFSDFTGQHRTTAIWYMESNHVELFDYTYKKDMAKVEDLIFDKLRLDKPMKSTFTFDGVSRDLFFYSKKDLQYKVGEIYSKTLNIVA